MTQSNTPLIRSIRQASRAMIRELGLLQMPGASMPRCHALVELAQHGCLTVLALAELLHLDKSSASRVMARLEKEGLVESRPNDTDRRQKPMALTKAGHEAVQNIQVHADRQVHEALNTLRPEEREQVLNGLSLYAKALGRARERQAYTVRPIQKEDNPAIARIIRDTLREYNADRPGFAFTDPEVDCMFETYSGEDRAYYVVVGGDQILGGGGFSPLKGGPEDTCELQKMYFDSSIRGLGFGSEILGKCLEKATAVGYKGCYLETLPHMERAGRLYRGFGFQRRSKSMGKTGHCGCDTYYYKDLQEVQSSEPEPSTTVSEEGQCTATLCGQAPQISNTCAPAQ